MKKKSARTSARSTRRAAKVARRSASGRGFQHDEQRGAIAAHGADRWIWFFGRMRTSTTVDEESTRG